MTVDLILLLIAAVCFAAAALNVKSPIQLLPLGLFCWVLTALI